jgi:hypothetical protein
VPLGKKALRQGRGGLRRRLLHAALQIGGHLRPGLPEFFGVERRGPQHLGRNLQNPRQVVYQRPAGHLHEQAVARQVQLRATRFQHAGQRKAVAVLRALVEQGHRELLAERIPRGEVRIRHERPPEGDHVVHRRAERQKAPGPAVRS